MIGLMSALAVGGVATLAIETATNAHAAFVAHLKSPPVRAATNQDILIPPAQMDSADAAVRRSVANRLVPGAAIAIGERDRMIQIAGYGRVGWSPRSAAVSPDSTLYDLASLTKAVATTTAVLLLVQDGKIHLDDPVQRALPEFEGKMKERVTWRQLLTHTSGLPPAGRMRGRIPSQRLQSLLRTKLDAAPGVYVQYSDLSFITLWAAAERVAGEPLPDFLERRVWRPLAMSSTVFWPGASCMRCAPTLTLASGVPYRGKPSDPIAHAIGEPTGNAGLFSSAHDLARFAAMIANGGTLGTVHILDSALVQQLFTQTTHAGHRTLGWDAFCPAEHVGQQQLCRAPIAFGHTGWTGTSLWIDPTRGVWVVILSNRSYDVKHPASLDELRGDVFLDVAGVASDSAKAVAKSPRPADDMPTTAVHVPTSVPPRAR
jgi:CubicO group peptidase (beta-lactamase class C family)